MELHLKAIGVLLLILAGVHSFFPRYFNWKELDSLTLINRQMMKVHTLFIAVTVFLVGLLCVHSSEEIVNTTLGKTISFGLALFWTLRLLIQFFGYSSKLWKGKPFETLVHIIFSCLWIYFSIIFWIISLG